MNDKSKIPAEHAELVARTTDFICSARRIDRLDSDTPLFEAKVINSMFVIQLINFVEKDLGVTLSDDDLVIANFASVNRIAEFVLSKRA